MPALVTVVAVLLGGALLGIGVLWWSSRRPTALVLLAGGVLCPAWTTPEHPPSSAPLTCVAPITGRPQPVWVSLAARTHRPGGCRRRGTQMGLADKASNKAEELKGEGKEATGQATNDPELEAEGKTDQAKGNLKQAGEKVKDVFK